MKPYKPIVFGFSCSIISLFMLTGCTSFKTIGKIENDSLLIAKLEPNKKYMLILKGGARVVMRYQNTKSDSIFGIKAHISRRDYKGRMMSWENYAKPVMVSSVTEVKGKEVNPYTTLACMLVVGFVIYVYIILSTWTLL